MSVHVSSWAWRQKLGDNGAKVVLLKLADACNDDGICWPSQKTLAEHCEMSDRNVRYKIEKLQELGLLEVKPRVRDDGSQTSNVYCLASGSPLPMGDGSPLPTENHQIETEKPLGGNPLPPPSDSKLCPQCGLTIKGKTVAEHLADTHGIGILEAAEEYAEATKDVA